MALFEEMQKNLRAYSPDICDPCKLGNHASCSKTVEAEGGKLVQCACDYVNEPEQATK